jgi:two-component system NtrC family sensor kinase
LDQPLVRIAVLDAAASDPRAPSGALGILRENLGQDASVERVGDAATCLALCEEGLDLVVLDCARESEAALVLAELRDSGPPVVVVTRDGSEGAALEAFRRGAAECVRVDRDFRDLLPEVALEQIRRWRELRERGAAEQRIRWLERLNDAIVTQIPAALAVVDGRERVVTVNPEFSRALGVDGRRAAGRRFDEVCPPDLIESGELRELLAQTAAGRPAAPRLARTEQVKGAESGLMFDARAQLLDEEGRVLLVLSDVTEREKLARRIRDLQRYNENIIQNMNSALLVVDEGGTITFANATAESILGAPPGGLRGRSIWDWLRAPSPERSLLARTLSEGVRFRGAETVLTLDDGSVAPIGISCAPLSDGDSKRRLGAVAIFQDLSEIKQLQRQVLQTEKMASIGQLAAGVAHEINNPTGFIHANLYQMAEYVGDLRRAWEGAAQLREVAERGELPELRRATAALDSLWREIDVDFVLQDFAKAIRESQEGSERIRHIVHDLRDFSHQDTAERVPADLNQCVDSTASIVWPMMKHSVALRKEYSDLPKVSCYPMQLKQVFMNLLVNAFQAIEERVAGSGETGEIHIRTARARGGVVVAIRDTGVGIPAEDLPRIFDPFFTTKEVGAGTGLGLSTSFSIVQRHGGSIRVESRMGEGSSFEVWLPLDEAGAAGRDRV